MFRCFLLIIFATTTVTAFYEKGTDVITITQRNWKDVEKSNHTWFIEFYREGCGFCRLLEPEWSEAATKLKHIVKVGAVDVEEERALSSNFEINGVPTVILFQPITDKKKKSSKKVPKKQIPYQGERKVGPIVEFAHSNMVSHVTYIKSGAEKWNAWVESCGELPKALVLHGKSVVGPVFKALSAEYRNRFCFGHTGFKNDYVVQLIKDSSGLDFKTNSKEALFFAWNTKKDKWVQYQKDKLAFMSLDFFLYPLVPKKKK